MIPSRACVSLRATAALFLLLAACQGSITSQEDALADDSELQRVDDDGPISAGPIVVTPRPPAVTFTPVIDEGQKPLSAMMRSQDVVGGVSGRYAIGFAPRGMTCPPPADSTWESTSLFGNADVHETTGLHFCAYQLKAAPTGTCLIRGKRVSGVECTESTVVSAEALKSLPGFCSGCSSKMGNAATDMTADWLAPVDNNLSQAGGLEESKAAIAAVLRSRFAEQMALLPANMPAGFPGALPQTRKVFVLDDAMSATDPNGIHGRAVGEVIKAVACPQNRYNSSLKCMVEVNYIDVFGDPAADPEQTAQKSKMASTFSVIRAIMTAVNSGAHVINMSFGTPAEMAQLPHSGDVATETIAYRAVQAAINYAACHNVMVVTAAGNRDGGPHESDPVIGPNTFYPGTFAQYGAWSCEPNTTGTPSNIDRPNLVPVGAIGVDGFESPTTRPNGRAQFMAPGYAMPLDDGMLYWEGSSFASAAFSGLAALTWSYVPSAKAFEPSPATATAPVGKSLFNLILDNAATVPNVSNNLFISDQRVRKVQTCQAVKEALHRTCAMSGKSGLLHFACDMYNQLSCPSDTSTGAPKVAAGSVQPLVNAIDASTKPAYASVTDPLCPQGSLGSALPPPPVDPNDDHAEPPPAEPMCPFELVGNGQDRHEAMCKTPGGRGICKSCQVSMRGGVGTINGTLDDDEKANLQSASLKVKIPHAGSGNSSSKLTGGGNGETLPYDVRYIELGPLLRANPNGQEISIKVFDAPLGVQVPNAVLDFTLLDNGVTQAFSTPIPVVEVP